MPFHWPEFLSLARWLQTNTPEGVSREAADRSGVSRAYYAAFGHALQYAVSHLGFKPGNVADDHVDVRKLFKVKRFKTYSKLGQLRDWRNQCDYENDSTVDFAAMLGNAISAAEHIIIDLSPPRSAKSGS